MKEELKGSIQVYAPMRSISKHNSDLAKFIGILTTFLVSGLFYELIFFYTTRMTPSGKITFLYVLHGMYTASVVTAVWKPGGWLWAVRAAMAFMVVTFGWLYYPQINRATKYNTPMKPCPSLISSATSNL
ncbi:unnamed protein product [Microthlaspi erraticum]|uniref:Uncharacterized protein n=1 Tax=Microthlaspi erraticum TaxID=1685480 RepID=A0A6D2HVX0_9BRAS|nr:unnamed protein product [Microthlaspi erraticum]